MAHEEFHNYLRLLVLLNDYGGKTLRDTFKARYKFSENAEWTDGSQASKDFHQTLGKPVFKKSKSIQKQMLREGDLQKWDLPLIYAVLQKIDFSKGVAQIKKKHDDENKIIAELIQVRNRLQHLPGKPISSDLFSELWQIAEPSLVSLGVPLEEIEHVRTCKDLHGIEFKSSNEINHENTLKAKASKEEGNTATKSNQLEKAIQFYSQGLNLYGVSPVEQGILHSNRSSVYLKLSEEAKDVDDEAQENLRLAMEDAKAAIDLRPTWWKGYYRLGRVHQVKKDWKLAITAFDQALGLNVGDKEILGARDACRLHEASELANDHLHSCTFMTMTNPDSDEILANFREARGLTGDDATQITVDHIFQQHEKLLNSRNPEERSLGLVFFAHRYKLGIDGFSQNYKKAAEYFQEAADIGNATALYEIGVIYQWGQGVSPDVFKAVEYFEKGAKCPLDGFFGYNEEGVEGSMFAIGKCFHCGVGKPKDYFKAAKWYSRSANIGGGQAASNLASLYEGGLGVERSQERAMQYWKLAACLGIHQALQSLAKQHLQLKNFTKAQEYFSQAVKSGHIPSKLQQEEFEKNLKASRSSQANVFLYNENNMNENYEEQFCFSKTDLGQIVLMSANSKKFSLPLTKNRSIDESAYAKYWLRVDEIKTFAAAGFKYAQKILSAMNHFKEGKQYLNLLLDAELETISCDVQSKILRGFSNCLREASFVVEYSNGDLEKLLQISMNVMKSSGDSKSEEDCNARICYSLVIVNFLKEAVDFLGMCTVKYPHERFFPDWQIALLAILQRYDEALGILKEALKAFPGDIELLISNAQMLCLKYVKFGKMDNLKASSIAFEEVLQLMPPDHYLLPEVCYSLGYICLEREEMRREVENYYRLGLEAEKNLLSAFIPRYSSLKEVLQQKLNIPACNSNESEIPFEEADSSSVSRKLQPTNPMRIFLVLKHRRMFINHRHCYYNTRDTISKPLKEQKLPSQLTGLKSILLDDMDCTLDHVYEGTVLNATIMEDSIFDERTCIASIIKDENGDFIPCFFYNFDSNEDDTRKKLSFGSNISIINPYHRLTCTFSWNIRVDDPQTVVFHSTGDEESLCRFCWVGGAQFHCAKCNRVNYCSKECQRQDWKLLKHKLICKV